MVRTNKEQQKMNVVLATYKISTTKEIDGGLYGELIKPDGTNYQTRVAGQFSRDTCTCPAFIYHGVGGCKHIEALRELRSHVNGGG